MTTHILSPNTQAILLLCASLGQPRTSAPQPLSQSEYNRVAYWLRSHQLQPADLLDEQTTSMVDPALCSRDRLKGLLGRGSALALAVEGWTNKSLWIVSRSDRSYPKRLKTRLGQEAPPILYGAGNQELLERGGLVIVGSRNVTQEEIDITRTIARRCAQEGIQVISGGARGVDSEAMAGALEGRGQVVGVLADSLTKSAMSAKYRAALRDGNLVLISAYDPGAGFNVGHAMARNKFMYGLGDWGLVISATFNKGGTWAGATENLAHRWVPLFVRIAQAAPSGNHQLLNQGGLALDAEILPALPSLQAWLNETKSFPTAAGAQDTDTEPATDLITADLFKVVWPHIQATLQTPIGEKELAAHFNVTQPQMRQWLTQALELGRVEKLLRPARYVALTTPRQEQLPLAILTEG